MNDVRSIPAVLLRMRHRRFCWEDTDEHSQSAGGCRDFCDGEGGMSGDRRFPGCVSPACRIGRRDVDSSKHVWPQCTYPCRHTIRIPARYHVGIFLAVMNACRVARRGNELGILPVDHIIFGGNRCVSIVSANLQLAEVIGFPRRNSRLRPDLVCLTIWRLCDL